MTKILKTAPLAIRIRPNIKADIQRLAEADNRSIASYVELVLQEHIENAEPKRKSVRSR